MASTDHIRVDSQFGVDDPDAIEVLIRRMIEQRSMLEASLGEGSVALLTVVLDVDTRHGYIVLDASPHPHVERRVLAADELAFATQVDRVNVRFRTGPFEKIAFEGLPAYRAPVPERMQYLQRREFFRLEVPPSHPAYCQLLVPASEDHPPRELRTRLFDISAGGLSLLVPVGAEELLAPGTHFAACRLLLPESSPALVSLRVRRNFRTPRGRGPVHTCAGCEFEQVTPQAQTIIQRYLMRLDRERIARERGRTPR